MKRLVITLAATTALFASTTIHYFRALAAEKARTQIATSPAGPDLPPRRDANPGPPAQAAAIHTESSEPPSRDAGQLAVDRHRLAQLDDPAARAERAAQIRRLMANDWSAIAVGIQMPPHELELLLDSLTEQRLRGVRRQAECRLDAACSMQQLQAALKLERDEHLQMALGPQRFVQYTRYTAAFQERNYVLQMRERLSSGQAPSEIEAERLVLALLDERAPYVGQSPQRAKMIDELLGHRAIRSTPSDPEEEIPERARLAADYTARLQKRAAELLTAPQLDAFKAMQAERLAHYQKSVGDKVAADAARRAGNAQ